MPAELLASDSTQFNHSPEATSGGATRNGTATHTKGTAEYFQAKHEAALKEMPYLRSTPLLPSEAGVFEEPATPEANKRPKKVFIKKHSSFALHGLVGQSMDALVQQGATLAQEQELPALQDQTVKRQEGDRLACLACLAKCSCINDTTTTCKWAAHTVCANLSCGNVLLLEHCTRPSCIAAKKTCCQEREGSK
jgi:hypothetical protein